ncbi:hypothetical protein AVEN_198743-1 [Araneus ventricosus]|uniref:Uncharacterized protein n=1 Tax=Araneus ventricosus TaxID=182803 RepID=A0A4Y2DI05_ARAVE|nr:hypothetical protein AVEN_272170-1 [Araneus ventricosus]GBM16689.1 hypothetical protein AVEN_198743-1 [Araneus ventricosus]
MIAFEFIFEDSWWTGGKVRSTSQVPGGLPEEFLEDYLLFSRKFLVDYSKNRLRTAGRSVFEFYQGFLTDCCMDSVRFRVTIHLKDS